MDAMLEICARLQNVPINPRHSRKLIVSIAKHSLCTTFALSKVTCSSLTCMSGPSHSCIKAERVVLTGMLGIAKAFATLR